MTDHPLGDITGTLANPGGEEPPTPPTLGEPRSIVDEVLNLDDFLSGDVRLAERTARFCTRPELEARIEDLHAELDSLTDSQGRPRPVTDEPLGDGRRSALLVASEIEEVQRDYAAAMATVRLRAMDEDDWTAFQGRQKEVLAADPPYPAEFYEDLIVSSSAMVTFPGGKPEKISAAQLVKLRKALGHAAFNEIAQAAWGVNTTSGVSVPKSLLSSAVLRQQQPG